MADIKGMNVTGQKVTPNAYGIHERGKYTGSITGMNATQNGTPNMSVMVAVGTAVLTKNTNSSVTAILDTPTNITIATASTANPRIDTLVVYEDLSVLMPTAEPYSIDAANGRFKIVSIDGTPGASPVAPDDTAIQSAIGGANTSWARICTVLVDKNATTIIDSKIDNSVKLLLSSILAPGAVTPAKVSFPTIVAVGRASYTAGAGAGVDITVTIPTQPDTNYYVMVTHSNATAVNQWTKIFAMVGAKTASNFKINVWNDGSLLVSAYYEYVVMR